MRFSPTLIFHIAAGTVALLAGAAAMAFRKGSRGHRVAGNIFVIAMLGLSVSGAYLGFMKQQMLNGFMGVLSFYLVITAWWTARRGDGKTGIFDWGALVVPLAVAVALMTFGVEAANSPRGFKGGYPAGAYFVFGSLALIFAAGDVRMLMRGGVSGTQRIARHLRRMCFALFIATGSFFLGQQQVFPAAMRKTNLLLFLGVLPLMLMIFWLLRVRFTNAYKRMSFAGGQS
jgi:hypothetical protein